MADRMVLQPITLRDARAFVAAHHRHHKAPQGGLFAVACANPEEVRGVAIIGKPVARMNNDGWTAEVTRCCTLGDANACSMLYAAAWRAARALGYRRLLTYTLISEQGASLRAASWKVIGQTQGGSWSRPSRLRADSHPTEQKTIWSAA